MALHLSVKFEDRIKVGDAIITVRKNHRGNCVSLVIDAPQSTKIIRENAKNKEEKKRD